MHIDDVWDEVRNKEEEEMKEGWFGVDIAEKKQTGNKRPLNPEIYQ